jgi:ATP synthase protein I
MHNLDVQRAKSILIAQLITLVVVALVVLLIDPPSARDALIGGAAAVLGTALFAVWVFGRYSASEPGQIVARFYGGEVIKIVAIVAVFAAAMKGLEDLNPVALFGSFLVVQVLPPLLANRVAR